MYQLYIDKKNCKLKVDKLKKSFQDYGPLIAFEHTHVKKMIYLITMIVTRCAKVEKF